jgi:hypothetical protein
MRNVKTTLAALALVSVLVAERPMSIRLQRLPNQRFRRCRVMPAIEKKTMTELSRS